MELRLTGADAEDALGRGRAALPCLAASRLGLGFDLPIDIAEGGRAR